MHKFILAITALVSATLLLTACHSQSTSNNSTASSHNRNMSTYELQRKYVALTDAAMKPVTLVNQQSKGANSQLSESVDTATQSVEQLNSDLKRNRTQPTLTKALLHYSQTISTLLTTIKDTENSAYSQNFLSLNTEAQKLAKKYFNNEQPDSLKTVLAEQAENNTYASGNTVNTKNFQIKFSKIQVVSNDTNGQVILFTYTFQNKGKTALTPAVVLQQYGQFQQNGVQINEGAPATSYQQSESSYATANNQANTAVAAGQTVTAVVGLTLQNDTDTVEYIGTNPTNKQSIGTISIKLQQTNS
ncbi:DUF5067 domain-containing protein [Loigolactobacillus zhaoyuanensis]|uniref:DUF5067 domain-containing protein n=1 Tax=Loigolactobacillus zhaoyuanensis TaxID=2486017 RepID=A0ABW8UEI2_9LACO|nr:DUF5067 domain-containing protein [Loigolactobacillus zhaoyuanensis]